MITAENARFSLFFHQESLIFSVLASVSLLSKVKGVLESTSLARVCFYHCERQGSSRHSPLVPMALTNFILPVGREVRLQYAFAERLICEVALIGAFYTHIANLFLRSAIERSSMLACLRPLHPALSQITRLLSIV